MAVRGAPSGESSDDGYTKEEIALDDALELIRGTAKDHPDWPTPHLTLSRMLFQAGQSAAPRRALELAAAEAPDGPSVYLSFAAIALGEGRLSDARLNAERALAASESRKLEGEPSRIVVREGRGVLATVAEARADWSSAREQLAAMLELDPKDAPARERLARALFQLGKPEDAFRGLQRAKADAPKLGPPGVTMARLWAQEGDEESAEKWFAYAAKVDPKDATHRPAHARWLLDRDRFDDARAEVDEAATITADSPEIERMRGLIAWRARDFEEAERAFEALRRASPADLAVADLLARSLIEQGDFGRPGQPGHRLFPRLPAGGSRPEG